MSPPNDYLVPRGKGPIVIIDPESGAPVPIETTPISTTKPAQADNYTAKVKTEKAPKEPKAPKTPKTPKEPKAIRPPRAQNPPTAPNAFNPPPGHSGVVPFSGGNDYVPGFDVYATPFVPQSLRIISTARGNLIDTPPLRSVDLAGYANAALGQLLLPQIPHPLDPDPNVLPETWSLAPSTYEAYFRSWLESEVRCQQKENETYSLYDTRGTVTYSRDPPPAGGPVATCTVSVPGLREYSPYVEEDDVINLRLLRVDRFGNMVPWSVTNLAWNGLIYRARVSAVVRSKDLLVMQVQGLIPHTGEVALRHGFDGFPGGTYELKFNVQFPVPDERYKAMKLVLPQIQVALDDAALNTLKEAYASPMMTTAGGPFNYWVQSMLFPTEADCDLQANLPSGRFNQLFLDDKLNWEQKNAVENVCMQTYGTVPYIISGPPGTGKTKTLIETALQLLRNVDQICHILICAPSEPATDTLADRLRHHLAPQDMLRLNRPNRTFGEVSDELLPYCCVSDNMFALPPFAKLMKYRVVVTSCRDGSLLMYSRMTNSDLYAVEHGLRQHIRPFSDETPATVKLHWTALLLDEAAQALEPEALLPIYVVSPPRRSPKLDFTPLFVMAGDECQLGPRTSSPKTPLKRSLFARLFARPVYSEHPLARGKTGQAPPALTKSMLPMLRPAFTNLIRNYRSHPAILAVPSSLFYFDTLEASSCNTAILAGWDGWRGLKWPMLFHNNPSPDALERDGGGWYNNGEADVACSYASALVSFLGGRQQQEVCIMSPFKAQVRLLREKARGMNLHGVNIGPTEAFQGLEHGVVILCVTRASRRFVENDKALSWGIIGQPNKMNVALTRAKYGLIVVGSREVLFDDPHWRSVLNFCYRNGLVAGEDGGSRDESVPTVDGPLTRFERDLHVAAAAAGAVKALAINGHHATATETAARSTATTTAEDSDVVA